MKATTLVPLLAATLALGGCDLLKDALDELDDTATGSDEGNVDDTVAVVDTAADDTGPTSNDDTGEDSGEDTSGDTGEDTSADVLAAIIDFQCVDVACVELLLSSEESLGDIATRTWTINGVVYDDDGTGKRSVELTVDALDTLALTVDDGRGASDTQTLYALATDDAFSETATLEEKIEMTVITGPLGLCGTNDPNRVVSIGGCVTDTLSIRFQDPSLPPGASNGVIYDVSSNSLTSLGLAVGAAWAQAPGSEQFAGDVNSSNYGYAPSFTYRKAVETNAASHFSFYFYGLTASVTTLHSLHQEPGATTSDPPTWVAADQAMQFSCEGPGEPVVLITSVGSGGVTFP